MQLDQAASPLHLFFQLLDAVMIVERVVGLQLISPIGDHHNGVRLFDQIRVIGPTVQNNSGLNVPDLRMVEKVFQQYGGLFVFMRVFCVPGYGTRQDQDPLRCVCSIERA